MNTVHDAAMFTDQYKFIRGDYGQDYQCADLSHKQLQCW